MVAGSPPPSRASTTSHRAEAGRERLSGSRRRDLAPRHARRPGTPHAAVPDDRQEVCHAHETKHEIVGRTVVDLLRRSDLAQPSSFVHHGQSIGDTEGDLLVVGDVEDRDAEGALELPDLETHLLAQIGIEIVERLVEQQQPRSRHQCPGESPLSAAGHPTVARAAAPPDRPGRPAQPLPGCARLRSSAAIFASFSG